LSSINHNLQTINRGDLLSQFRLQELEQEIAELLKAGSGRLDGGIVAALGCECSAASARSSLLPT